MRGPRVTIVTPSYNQGRFLHRTIDSVLSQDYPHLEYLVFDGGSTDESVEILNSYGTRLNWRSERDLDGSIRAGIIDHDDLNVSIRNGSKVLRSLMEVLESLR